MRPVLWRREGGEKERGLGTQAHKGGVIFLFRKHERMSPCVSVVCVCVRAIERKRTEKVCSSSVYSDQSW